MVSINQMHLEDGFVTVSNSEVAINDSLIYVNENNIQPIKALWSDYSQPNISLKNLLLCPFCKTQPMEYHSLPRHTYSCRQKTSQSL